jgi:CDP-paratose 2-epimerase
MSIDSTLHSLFGASKLSADILVQEYGRYFNMNTVCFRGGCLSGPAHSGTSLHGFLSYLVKSIVKGSKYTIFGYKGKQVRDNIHSFDLVNAFYEFYKQPKSGVVYNIGGGVNSNCSMIEAIKIGEQVADKKLIYDYSERPRIGDHIWYVSDLTKFKKDYPKWKLSYNIEQLISEIYSQNIDRWNSE